MSKNCSHSVVESCVAFVLHPFFSWDIEPSRGKNSSRIELNAFFVKKLGEFGATNPCSKNLSPKKHCSHMVVESCVAFVLHPFFSWDIEPSRGKNSSRIELNAFFVKKFRRIRGHKSKTYKPISKHCSHSVVAPCVAFVLHPFFSWDIELSRGKNSSRIELNAFFVKKLGEFGATIPSSKNPLQKLLPFGGGVMCCHCAAPILFVGHRTLAWEK